MTNSVDANVTDENRIKQVVLDDWILFCNDKDNKCMARQVISLKQENGTKDMLALSLVKTANNLSLELKLPFGLDLRRGVATRVDQEDEETFGFLTCMPDGCTAVMPLTEERIKKMNTGNKLAVGVLPLGGKRLVAVESSLKGFEDALKRVSLGK